MRYYLGLDNGGTTTKAALFDIHGKEICVVSTSTEMITPKPGFVERDMEEMWQANCKVIKAVMEKSGIAPEAVAGIGVCGHGKGLYLWGKDNKPVRNGIISTDNRAYRYVEKWSADGTEAKVFDISCQHVMSCQPVALLAWIKDNEPEAYDRIQYVFECKDYVRFRLTGRASAEFTDYSGANFLNLKTRAYDKRLFDLFGISEMAACMPPLCKAVDICGYISSETAEETGLLEGTPVIGGMFDIDACALAVGITDEENLCMIAGTWSINEYIRKTPVLDGTVSMNSLFCLPEYYLVEESSATSAGNNEWFVQQLLPELCEQAKAEGKSVYDYLNEWVTEIPPEEFVPVFLPYLMGSNVHPNAKSAFVGMSINHTRKHLARSIYEGIGFCHKMHIDKLIASRQKEPKAIRLAGGAAHSREWTQILADILQIPIETVNANETGALGCAVAVAVAVGDYESLEAAVGGMCEIASPVLPNKALAEVYNKKYRLFNHVVNSLDGVWDEMQSYIECCSSGKA